MARKLSSESITTFRGNVLPLRLQGGEPYSKDKITWSCSDESIVQLTRYNKNYRYGGEFTDGVLLTFLEVGEATVTAKIGKKEYVCNIEVREMKRAESSKELRYFVGDMHDHTYNKHKLAEFTPRDASLYPINNYMRQMKECGKMDFGVVSDHGNLLTAADFFRGYADAEDIGDDVIYFPGCEGQVTVIEPDRYGVDHMHGGEVLIFNADIAFTTRSWNDFFKKLEHSPFAFCGFPHPQAVGGSVPGVWNFDLEKNNSERFRNIFRFVEMGDGGNRSCNVLHYFTYSVALDNGFHVSPTCASDSHGSKGGWGYDRFPGKTVIMAPEKSKEAFLDAILSNRMYASSTGNVKLYYEVNGKAAPATLNNEGEYRFHVELGYFRMGEEDTRIKRCRVISDKGKTVLELENMGDMFDFTVYKPDAHWFYLQLLDEQGRYTWSCPVWTGLPFEAKKKLKKIVPIEKKDIVCTEEKSGADASAVTNDDPTIPWHFEDTTASLLFDLGKEEKVTAFSFYPKFLTWTELKENNPLELKKDDLPRSRLKEYPSKYRLWASKDGKDFTRVSEGLFRNFGFEEPIRFERTNARYMRLEILETVGRAWQREELADANITIGEITFWK